MSLAILISGGLDSAVLLGDTLRRGETVHPLFVRCGLRWETIELEYLRRYLDALAGPNLKPLIILEQPVADLYGDHWSMTGRGVPHAETSDEAVFLPGRNVLLLAKSMLWCHLHHVPAVALGALQSNPFPDATPEFFRAIEDVVNRAVNGNVRIELPFALLKKKDVMKLGRGLPLEHTFSCIQPLMRLTTNTPHSGHHCGRCNKCAERRQAFVDAGLSDPTVYNS
ncbi:MAG: 7-cyano-7-deazaguanine synthase [Gemmataceae bacterium]|nr:7-cyano-7-deazaguanine synthase [Gemmataceae bacterium]